MILDGDFRRQHTSNGWKEAIWGLHPEDDIREQQTLLWGARLR